MSAMAVVLSSAAFFAAVVLYLDGREHTENLRVHSIAGCERQNVLRRELNDVLAEFDIAPRFAQVDCMAAYEADTR